MDGNHTRASFDPILTEVIYNQVLGIASEMGSVLARTAFSPNIKQRFDFSTAVVGVTGEVLAQAPRIPIHLGSMIGSVRELLKSRTLEEMRPGDMFAANDPFNGGGQHLPDINIISPVFHDGKPIAFVANIAHHADVGGTYAGSEAVACRNIFQEGLRLPTVQIMREGTLVSDIMAIITLNTRTPEERRGDVLAQIAANKIGQRRLEECAEKYGAERLIRTLNHYMDATEARFRAVLASIPDGEVSVSDFLDPDVYAPDQEVPLHLRMEKRGEDLFLDFEGTAPQLTSARNVPLGALYSTVYCVVKMMLDHGMAANSGYFRAIHIASPEGSVLNPAPGAAVGVRAMACSIVGDVVADAISKLVPQKALAGCGPHHQVIFSGTHAGTGKIWVNYETYAGAQGARPYMSGIDCVRVHASGSSNLPIEALEQAYPLRIERYEIDEASAGAGEFRGGAGAIRDYRMLDDVSITLAAERQTSGAKGIEGGQDGAKGLFVLNPGSDNEQILKSAVGGMQLSRGDLLSVRTPGGGGYGRG